MLIEILERRRLLSVVPSLIEIPITAAAKASDPTLNNYRALDLRVTVTADDDWLSGDLIAHLSSGQCYIPAQSNSNIAQPALWTQSPNLEFDTFVTTPNFGVPTFVSRSNGPGEAIFTITDINAAWGDLVKTGAGTFTIARMTVSAD